MAGESEARPGWFVPASILVAGTLIAAAIVGSALLVLNQQSAAPSRSLSSPASRLVRADPQSLVLQNADVPFGYLPDGQGTHANSDIFTGIGPHHIGALLIGAVPSDSYQATFNAPVASAYEHWAVVSGIAIYPRIEDAAAVHPGQYPLFTNEVPLSSQLGDGGHEYVSSQSSQLVLIILYWHDRNVVGYLRWVFLATSPAGVPHDIASAAIDDAAALAHRMETHVRMS